MVLKWNDFEDYPIQTIQTPDLVSSSWNRNYEIIYQKKTRKGGKSEEYAAQKITRYDEIVYSSALLHIKLIL